MFHFRTGNNTKWGDRTLTPPGENPAVEASRYLAAGRIITAVAEDQVRATTRGEGAIYSVTYDRYVRACTHPARTARCCHLVAIRRVVAVEVDGTGTGTSARSGGGGCTTGITYCTPAPAAAPPPLPLSNGNGPRSSTS